MVLPPCSSSKRNRVKGVLESNNYTELLHTSKDELPGAGCWSLLSIVNKDGFTVSAGLIEMKERILIELIGKGIVVVDVRKKELLKVNELDLRGVEHYEILDLSDEGDRWEGSVLDNEPCGWGIAYDKEGRMAYEGFRVGDRNVGYGRKYYADLSTIEYDGEWCNGVRWGKGIQYDRLGCVVYRGEWLNDSLMERSVRITPDYSFIHNHVEELTVSSQFGNDKEWSVLDFHLMPYLKSLNVGDDCFESVEEVKLMGLRELERVVIGMNSFTAERFFFGEGANRHFYLKNCPLLRELKIGQYSFSDYSVCEIESVDALEVIEMGDLDDWSYNFKPASLELRGICFFMLK